MKETLINAFSAAKWLNDQLITVIGSLTEKSEELLRTHLSWKSSWWTLTLACFGTGASPCRASHATSSLASERPIKSTKAYIENKTTHLQLEHAKISFNTKTMLDSTAKKKQELSINNVKQFWPAGSFLVRNTRQSAMWKPHAQIQRAFLIDLTHRYKIRF